MREKVEIEIGIKDRFSSGFSAVRSQMEATERVSDRFNKTTDELSASVKTAVEKFKESSASVEKLKEEFKGLAEGGASADVLIAKARKLADAQRKAANDGAEALMANQKYWTALSIAGEDIGEVRTRHLELASSYNEMSARAKSTQATVDEYSRKLSEERDRLKEVKTESEEAKRSTDKLKDSTDKASKSSKDYADKLNDVTNGAKGLPGPIGDAVSGIRGMTKASLRFIATPLGATLALISGLLATVTSWFKRTEEGQNALATGSAYFTQVLGSLLDVADDVGEWLYKAFSKPKEALTSLVDFMKGQVIDRLKDIGLMAQGIWRILNGQFTEGMNLLGTGYAHGMSGLLSIKGKVNSWMGETKKKAEERVSIAERQNKLDEEERKNLVERARLEKEISELREKAYDKGIPEKERAKAIKDAQEKTEKMYDEELRLARERYEIIRDTNSLTHSNKDDKKKEAEAEAELYRIESQRANALKGLMREQNRVDSSVLKSARAGAKAAKDAAEEREKLFELDMKEREQQAKQKQALEEALADKAIAEESNAAKRELMQMEKDHEERLAAVDRQEEEFKKQAYEAAKQRWEAQNKGKAWADTDEAKAGWEAMKLTLEQEKLLSAQRAAINSEDAQRQKEYMDNLVQQHQSYTDQRLEIDRRYQEEVTAYETAIAELRKKLATAGTDEERQEIERQIEALTRSLGEAAKGRLKELSDVAGRELQDSPLFSLAWKDLQNVSTETLNMLIEKFKEVEGQFSGDPQAMKEWTERIQAMSDEVAQRNPYKAIYEARTKYQVAETKRNNAIGRIDTITKEIAELEELIEIDKKSNSSNETTAKNQEQLKQKREELTEATTDLANAENDMTDSQSKEQKAFEESKRQVDELASAISALGNEIGGEAGKILNLIGNVMTFATSTAENMKKVAASGAQSISTMEKASVILTIISAAIQLAKQISDLLPDSTSQYEKYRDKVNEVNKMEQAVRDYEMAVLEAKNAEKSWFASSSLNDLSNQWLVSNKASENYFKKLNELQATYQNESGSGWLTKLGAQANKTIASITGKVNELVGIEDTFLGNMQTKMAQFGWANAMGGQIGMNMYLENEIWDKGFDKNYVEGLTAAWRNLRIETRAASKGFLGTGAGGHSQRTEDLVQYVKKELGLDLFDEDGWLNQEAYEQVIEKYGDKLVGETKATLEALDELTTQHKEFLNQLHEYVDQMYSPIVDNFVDAMWAWYDEGTDALESFRKSAGNTFRNIVSDMLKTQILGRFGTEMGDTISKLYEQYYDTQQITYEGLISGVKSAVNSAMSSFRESLPVLEQIMTVMDEGLNSIGISMKDVGDETASVFESMKDTFKSALLDMENDAEDFSKKVKKAFTDMLVNKSLTMPVVVNDKTYDNFDKYFEDWSKRVNYVLEADSNIADYEKEIANYERYIEDIRRGAANRDLTEGEQNGIEELQKKIAALKEEIAGLDEEGRKQKLEALNEELQQTYETMYKIAKTYADMTGWTMEQRIDASPFANLGDDLLSVLQDTSKSVEDWKDEIVKTMTDDLIKELVYNDAYKKQIRAFQEEYIHLFDTDENGNLLKTEEEIEAGINQLATDMANFATKTEETADRINNAMSKVTDSVESSFGDLHDSLMSSFLDMENGAKNFAQTLQETLTKDLIDKFVFGEAFELNGKQFSNYAEYQEDWMSRYLEALKNGDEELMRELTKEMEERQQAMAESAEYYAQTMNEAIADTTFTDMSGNFVSALMDMEGNVEDFANDLKKTIVQHLVESFMVSKYIQPLLEDLQNTLDYAMSQYEGGVAAGISRGLTEEEAVEQAMTNAASVLQFGYNDMEGVAHKGLNDVAGAITPLQSIVKTALQAAGYEVKEEEKAIEGAFDNLGDSILSSLMNTESGVEDFMRGITETVVNELVKSYMATEEFQNGLATVKKDLEDAAKAVAAAKTDEELAKANAQLEQAQKNAEAFYNAAVKGTEKYTDALKKVEVQQDTTFKDLGDSLLSALMDTTKSATDWAQDIGKVMAQKIFEGMIEARNAQGILDKIQFVFNEAVTSNTDANGNINWEEVASYEGLTAVVSDSKREFNSLREAWKRVCEALGLDYEEALNDLPLSDLGSNLIDSLLDTEQTAEDFGKKMAVNLMTEMLTELFNNRYTTKLNEIREHWQKALAGEDGYTLDSVRQEITDLRTELDNLAEDDPIRTLSGDIKELGKVIEESVPDDTFKGMADSWTSALIDMDATAENFGRQIGQTLVQKLVNELIVTKHLQKYLDDIQAAYDEAIGKDGADVNSVLAAVIPKIDAAVAETKEWLPVTQELAKRFQEIGGEDDGSTPFDNLRSSMLSALMDMTADAESFASDINKILTEAFVNEFVLGDAFDEQLEVWKQRYKEIMDSELSDEERARQLRGLQETINEAKEGYVKQTREIQDLMQYGEYQDQTATISMADKATYDQFEQYLGIAVAQQIATEQQLSIQQQILYTIQAMSELTAPGNDLVLQQLTTANNYLSGMYLGMKKMYNILEQHIVSIDEKCTGLRNIK